MENNGEYLDDTVKRMRMYFYYDVTPLSYDAIEYRVSAEERDCS